MNRALLNVSLCRSCRHEIGRSFSSVSGVSISRYNSLSSPRSYANRRPFSSVPRLLSDIPSVNPSESRAQVADEKELQSETESSAAKQHIPWYLQEETPITESQPVSSRDHLPELPEDPPAILPDLLEYTFKDLGLDNLKLFDLRVLETPPALGANVIMIIGTARSVKHINVAADRLCRWLRTTYKLTPYADGLLGRNELKIKLRRKARRARIASQSGAMVDERDDGITTGWICVNAGVVEDAPAVEQEAKDQGFEGFGSISAGTRVVVQIFTEEKRAEVDLDALWQGNLDRAERQRQRDSRAIANAPPKEVRAPQTTNRLSSDRDFRDVSRPQVSVPLEQRRGLHSTRPLRTHLNDESVDSLRAEPAPIQDSTHSSDNLGALIQHLSGLSDEQACHELGTGPEDRDSTLVLRRFYDWPPDFSAGNAALAHIQLMCVAISRQHQAYSKEGLWKAFVDYSLRNYPVSEDLGLRVVSALLTKQPVDRGLLDTDKEFALRALEHLSLRGAKVLNMKVLTMLYQAFSPEGVEVVSQDSKEGQALFRISKLIEILDIPFDPEQARTLMVSLFRNEDYDGFWKLWRKLALSGSPRTAADYERLFELHAELGDERRARDCIAAWVPMMSRENPPVALQGPILQHVMYCLVIADPEIQQTASEGSMSNLARLWRECRGKMLAEDGQF